MNPVELDLGLVTFRRLQEDDIAVELSFSEKFSVLRDAICINNILKDPVTIRTQNKYWSQVKVIRVDAANAESSDFISKRCAQNEVGFDDSELLSRAAFPGERHHEANYMSSKSHLCFVNNV